MSLSLSRSSTMMQSLMFWRNECPNQIVRKIGAQILLPMVTVHAILESLGLALLHILNIIKGNSSPLVLERLKSSALTIGWSMSCFFCNFKYELLAYDEAELRCNAKIPDFLL